jgi:putative hydrolase of HD superfamily
MPFVNSLFSLLEQINHLKQLPRTGWLLAGVTQVESIADHSFTVAILAMGLAETINADWAAHALDKPLDGDRVIKIALVHDLAESILTDLPKRSTDLLGREVKHAAEARALAQLLADLSNGDLYRLLWAEYDNNSSPEARLVRDADKLEMVHQALCYERRGHTNLEEFWQGHTWHYGVSQTLFEHLNQNRH